MNKWLLYDKANSKDGIRSKIYATYIEEPSQEFLKGKDYVITKEEFPSKEGYDTVLYANFADKHIEVEFAMNDKKVEESLVYFEKENLSTVAFSLELDFRLTEVEIVTGVGMASVMNIKNTDIKGVDNMRTQYDMMKTLITAGMYEVDDMVNKIHTYHDRYKKITTEQRDELLGLIEADILINGSK